MADTIEVLRMKLDQAAFRAEQLQAQLDAAKKTLEEFQAQSAAELARLKAEKNMLSAMYSDAAKQCALLQGPLARRQSASPGKDT